MLLSGKIASYVCGTAVYQPTYRLRAKKVRYIPYAFCRHSTCTECHINVSDTWNPDLHNNIIALLWMHFGTAESVPINF